MKYASSLVVRFWLASILETGDYMPTAEMPHALTSSPLGAQQTHCGRADTRDETLVACGIDQFRPCKKLPVAFTRLLDSMHLESWRICLAVGKSFLWWIELQAWREVNRAYPQIRIKMVLYGYSK